jgi:hypothetical protein
MKQEQTFCLPKNNWIQFRVKNRSLSNDYEIENDWSLIPSKINELELQKWKFYSLKNHS